MTIGVVTDLWYEMWIRDTACKFLWGKSQYFPSYLIIERSEAFNPVTLRGEPGTNSEAEQETKKNGARSAAAVVDMISEVFLLDVNISIL